MGLCLKSSENLGVINKQLQDLTAVVIVLSNQLKQKHLPATPSQHEKINNTNTDTENLGATSSEDSTLLESMTIDNDIGNLIPIEDPRFASLPQEEHSTSVVVHADHVNPGINKRSRSEKTKQRFDDRMEVNEHQEDEQITDNENTQIVQYWVTQHQWRIKCIRSHHWRRQQHEHQITIPFVCRLKIHRFHQVTFRLPTLQSDLLPPKSNTWKIPEKIRKIKTTSANIIQKKLNQWIQLPIRKACHTSLPEHRTGVLFDDQ